MCAHDIRTTRKYQTSISSNHFVVLIVILLFTFVTPNHVDVRYNSPVALSRTLLEALNVRYNGFGFPDSPERELGSITDKARRRLDANLLDHVGMFTIIASLDGKEVELILDTGSSDTWVLDCVSCNYSSERFPKPTPAVFEDAEGNVISDYLYNVTYLDGSHMTLMAFNGEMEIGSFSFPMVYGGGQPLLGMGDSFDGCDGISGFAFQGASVIQAPVPPQSVYPNKFGLYLPPRNSNPTTTFGALTMGGYNTSLFDGDLSFFDVALHSLAEFFSLEELENLNLTPDEINTKDRYSGFWDIDFDGIYLNDDPTPLATELTAILDSGTTMLLGPASVITEIYDALDVSCVYMNIEDFNNVEDEATSTDEWSIGKIIQPCSAPPPNPLLWYLIPPGFAAFVDCDSTISLAFTIQGESYELTEDDLLFTLGGGGDGGCGEGMRMDCIGTCFPNTYEFTSWKDDSTCDDGMRGLLLNCQEYDCDNDQCGNCGKQYCRLGLSSLPDEGYSGTFKPWLFGDTFLRRFYAAHDYTGRKIGFAPSVHPHSDSTWEYVPPPFPDPLDDEGGEQVGPGSDDHLPDDEGGEQVGPGSDDHLPDDDGGGEQVEPASDDGSSTETGDGSSNETGGGSPNEAGNDSSDGNPPDPSSSKPYAWLNTALVATTATAVAFALALLIRNRYRRNRATRFTRLAGPFDKGADVEEGGLEMREDVFVM